MPYSCWITATSKPFKTAAAAAGPPGEPFTRWDTTSGWKLGRRLVHHLYDTCVVVGSGSGRRFSSDALNVANPHWVGG